MSLTRTNFNGIVRIKERLDRDMEQFIKDEEKLALHQFFFGSKTADAKGPDEKEKLPDEEIKSEQVI